MKRLIIQGRALTLRDNFPNVEDYDFVDIGLQNIEVSKIVGICDSRADEYNDDLTPINKNDPRWIRIYNGYKNGKNVPPIPLILAPDGNFYGDGDGSHRISAAKVLNLQTVPAKVMKMVEREKGVNNSWEEYAKDKIEKLNKMSKEYQTMWPKFYKLQDEAFESGNHTEYEKFQNEMSELGNKISLLEDELMQEENKYKQNILKETANYKRLIAKPRDRGQDGKPINHMETSTKGKTNFAHRLLHMWWKNPEKTDWTKQQIIDEHIKVVKAMKDFSMNHNMIDGLDNVLPDYLKTKTEKTADDGGDISWETLNAPAEPIPPNIVTNEPTTQIPDRMWYPPYSVYKDKRIPKKRLKKKIKKAEYVHCHACEWDNGDFCYPSKDTVYYTKEEYENKNPNGICPKCGKQELDID